MIRCACQACQAALELPDHLAGGPFACPSCGHKFTVPQAETHKQSFMDRLLHSAENPRAGAVAFPPPTTITRTTEPATPASPPPAALPGPGPKPPPPAPRGDYDRRAWEDQGPYYDDRDRDRERDRDRDYDRDYDDDPYEARPRRAAYTREYAIRSALYGMICSMIGLLGILTGFFIFLLNSRRGQGGVQQLETTLLIVSIGSLVSFIFTLMGIIFSARGLDQSNDHNRGMAVAGLVCGIIGIVLSVLVGSFAFFCGMMLRALPF